MRFLWIIALVAMMPTGDSYAAGGDDMAMTEIFTRAAWYRGHPEPEREWCGKLSDRTPPGGPAGRPGLIYELATRDQRLPVYASEVELRLSPFVGTEVLVRGKLIDLTNEGFGPELWIGALGRLPCS